MILRFFFLIFTMAASTVAYALEWQAPLLQQHPLVGHIYDLDSQQRISEKELFQRLQQAPLVLIGEKHDNNDHHQIEARILKNLVTPTHSPAVVFEMLNDTQQPVLDQLAANSPLESIKTKLAWKPKSWPWKDYGPLFQLTLQLKAPLIAGNIHRERIRAIYGKQKDALAEPRFNTVKGIASSVREQINEEIYLNHCEMMPRTQLQPMVDIQLARDAAMADAMLQHRTRAGAILIAGGFHVRKDLSVPLHLNARAPELERAVVLLAEVEGGLTRLEDYRQNTSADYLWLTPKQDEKDHCAEMRKAMKQKGAKQG